jgi:hypothetical protein
MSDLVLQVFIDVMGYAPPDNDPIAELMNLYAEEIQQYAQTGSNDPLVCVMSDVTGIPIPDVSDPLLVFLTEGNFGDMKIRVRVDSATLNAVLIYYDEVYKDALSIDGDGNLVNNSDLDLSLDSAGYLQEALNG